MKIKNLPFLDMLSYQSNTRRFSQKLDGIDCCDGILGTPFLKKYPFLFERGKKIISIKGNVAKSFIDIPITIKGKDVIFLDCQMAGGNQFNFRLDTGSEAPLILQPPAIKKHFVREKLSLKGYDGKGPAQLVFTKLSCGKSHQVAINALYVPIKSGALAHTFAHGNIGPYLLGQSYYIDFKNKLLKVDPRGLPKKAQKLNFPKFELLFKKQSNNQFKPSLLLQAHILMLKSCIEQSVQGNECFTKTCKILGMNLCPAYDQAQPAFINAVSFFSNKMDTPDCKLQDILSHFEHSPLQHSYCQWKLTTNFKYPKDTVEINELESALPTPVDNKVSTKVLANPIYITKTFYCYYIFQKLITYKSLPAKLFAFSINGVSLSSASQKSYYKWQKTNEGAACNEYVKDSLGQNTTMFDSLFQDKTYLIILNPLVALADGAHLFKKNLLKHYNHERLHCLYADDPAIKNKANKLWRDLNEDKKEQFKKAHPSYDFTDNNTLMKEYFSYTYESNLSGLF
ncbi:hypothetical protein ISS03_05795 [Patescibacteria group bacterium]|nr:hypothetical protein [Patescibacteria group bacterium]